MNWPTLVLAILIALLQYPLWLGKGGWLRVWEHDRQLKAQKEFNQKLEQRNAGLDAEVRDLKSGYEAIEERARFELGMTREGEIFVQVPQKSQLSAPSAPTPANPTTIATKPVGGAVLVPEGKSQKHR